MKRYILFALFALVAASCVMEKSEFPVAEKEMTFTASFEPGGLTKTVLVDGNSIHWLPGDRISVSGAEGAFVSKSETASATTSFSGIAPLSEVYYAVYPYEVVNSWIGNTAIVNLPTEQKAVKGTFADDLNVSTAATTSADMSLTFQNVLGHMKFSVDNVSGSIVSVEIKANGGESLTGTASVSFDNAGKAVITPLAQSSTITLTSDKALEPGDYYVAMIPGTYKSGLTLTFTDTNGAVAVKSVTDELVLDAGVIQYIGTVSGLVFEGGSTTPPSDDEYIDFLDQNTETLCVLNWDTDGDNKLSYAEAAAVESVGTVFRGTNILSFDEFKYFTSVKKLEFQAFFECKQLRKLTLPKSLEELGQYSLTRLTSLKELVIPASVTVMNYELAAVCNSTLERLVVEEGNPVYDSRNGCNAIIHTATNTLIAGSAGTVIPDDVTIIGPRAFMESKIEHLVIPDSVKEIKSNAFQSASPKTVVIGNGIEDWGICSFTYCTGDFTINSNVPDADKGDDYISAPFMYSYLTNVTFGPDVTYIGANSFPKCMNVKKVTIPKNVTHLGIDIFCKTRMVTEVDIDCPVIGEMAFYNDCITKITIGDNVEVIEPKAFSSSWDLETVVMGNNVKKIGASAFANASKLKNINFPESLEEIGKAAFTQCKSLVSVELPDKLSSLGEQAFNTCLALKSVRLPDGLEIIGASTFSDCSALTEVNFPKSLKSIQSSAFSGTALKEIHLPEGLEEIGSGAFYGCTSVESVYVPSSVTKLKGTPFRDCTGELRVNYLPPTGYDDIGSDFPPYSHTGFSKIIIGADVKEIPYLTFTDSYKLEEVVFPDKLESIGGASFSYCSALKVAQLPSSLLSIGTNAFSRCSSLTSMNLPGSLTSIGDGIFEYCTALEKVVVGEGVKVIPQETFMCCYNLSEIDLPDSLEEILTWAFYECDALTEITLPENMKKMGAGVFSHSDNLRTIYCKATSPFTIDQGDFVMTGWQGVTFPICTQTIYVPTESLSTFKQVWKYYADIISPFDFE